MTLGADSSEGLRERSGRVGLTVTLSADDAADRRAAALAAGSGTASASDLGHGECAFAHHPPHRSIGDSVAVADEHRAGVLGLLRAPQ